MVNLRVVTVVALPPRATIHMTRDEICFLFDAGKNRRSKKGIADAKSRVRSGRKRRRIRENRTGNISPPAPSVNVTRHIPLSTITSRYKDARLEKSIRQGGYSIQFVLSGFSASFVTI